MALFYECREQWAQKALDTADIVRDGDISPTVHDGDDEPTTVFQQGRRNSSPTLHTSTLVGDVENLATVFIHCLGDMALLGAGGAIRKFAQLMPVGGRVLITEEKDLVFAVFTDRAGETRHDQFRPQGISLGTEKLGGHISLFAGSLANLEFIVVHVYRMLVVGVAKPDRTGDAVLVSVVTGGEKTFLLNDEHALDVFAGVRPHEYVAEPSCNVFDGEK
jgi:hypothetical protein